MKSVGQRVEEFVRYHKEGDGECNTIVLAEWAARHGLNDREKFELAYFFSITYAVESAIVLYLNREAALNDDAWASEHKEKLIFQSDMRWVKIGERFEQCLAWYRANGNPDDFLQRVADKNGIDVPKAVHIIETEWDRFGRFRAFVFLETYAKLTGTPTFNSQIEWKKGNTATSGILNVYGFDAQADCFDKTGHLKLPCETMDYLLLKLEQEIKKAGGSTNVTEVETSLCAYRKFYKATRYNGYYLDRMLEEINVMRGDYPEIISEVLDIRKHKFSPKYLGELGGWNGVRPELKKLYRETGIIFH